MRTSCTVVYVHFVWATRDRLPLITAGIRGRLYACIAESGHKIGCEVSRVGGTEDHVHALVRLPATVSVADAAKELKGASSHLATHVLCPGRCFKWQGTYGAFSVSPDGIEAVAAYIDCQEAHHGRSTTRAGWERCSLE